MPARRPAKKRRAATDNASRAPGVGKVGSVRSPRAERPAARDLSARDHAALAAVLDPIITIDARGTIQSASNSILRVLGWTPRELVGQNVSILMPEPHRSAHDGYLANYHRTGKTNIMNRPRRFEALRKDRSSIPIELCVSRADIPGGGPPLFVGIIRDMSAYAAVERSHEEERARSQQLLAEQTSALQQANLRLRMADRMASIGTLAAGLGHDMNNVLLPVRARLNALKAAGAAGRMPAAETRHVEEVRKSIGYLQQLADGLHFLAMDPDAEEDVRSGLGGGGMTDLQQWWAQVGTLLSKAVPRHVRVSASFPRDLPRAAIAAHGLTQAMLNLVVNAGEAIPGPGERKRRQGNVRVWAETMEDEGVACVRLGVTDNGLGMPDEVRRRAFEMFYTTKPRGLGTGLGLALVRNVAHRAGGRVEIESGVGKGTTVAMIVPAVRSTGQASVASDGPRAIVSLNDGRAAAIVRHILEASGAPVQSDQDCARANIWVLDPALVNLDKVRAWRAERPDGRIVLFGKPSVAALAAWQALAPLIIEDRDDFEAVRSALGRASASK